MALALSEKAILHVKSKTTVVRTAVARFESMPVTPIFARTAVSPAKNADSSAQKIQFMECFRHAVPVPTLRRLASSGNVSLAKGKNLQSRGRKPQSRDPPPPLVNL